MSIPQQRPGRSRQDYQTPPEFLAAVKDLLRIEEFEGDVAASAENAVCRRFITEEENALIAPWFEDGWNWCNPPFAHIVPWVERADGQWRYHHRKSALLLPASVGSNWWFDWVHGKCAVVLLGGRLTFVGQLACYPKDCVLLLYGMLPGYYRWNWLESPAEIML